MADEWAKLRFPSQPTRRYPVDRHRLFSASLAIAWLTLCAVGAGVAALMNNMLMIGLPLACIWFPEALGSLTTTLPSVISDRPITRRSPAIVVRIVGWFTLLTLTVGRVIIFMAMKP